MAVVKKFADDQLEAGSLAENQSGDSFSAGKAVAIAADDDNGSVYGVCIVSGASIPSSVDIQTTAVTGGADYDLGFYELDDQDIGDAADADVLMDGQTMATASLVLNGMKDVAAGDRGKSVADLVSGSESKTYVLALTANTIGTVAGTIHVDYTFYI